MTVIAGPSGNDRHCLGERSDLLQMVSSCPVMSLNPNNKPVIRYTKDIRRVGFDYRRYSSGYNTDWYNSDHSSDTVHCSSG